MSESEEMGLIYWQDQARLLLKKAQQHGISSVVILHEDDPLRRTSGLSWFNLGDPVLATGMIEEVRKQRAMST